MSSIIIFCTARARSQFPTTVHFKSAGGHPAAALVYCIHFTGVALLMGRFSSKPIERRSLGDLVYERLALELTEGRYGCGDELNEVALAGHLRVSRTPVRDALRRLAAEGLVVNGRNHRATVIEPSRREIEETYQVRQLLESAAARLAASRIA